MLFAHLPSAAVPTLPDATIFSNLLEAALLASDATVAHAAGQALAALVNKHQDNQALTDFLDMAAAKIGVCVCVHVCVCMCVCVCACVCICILRPSIASARNVSP